MTLQGGGFAAAVIPAAKHRSKIRGRPSGLKGRRRDRCATGRRPALDPGATTAPHAQRHRAGAGPLPAEPPRRLAAPIKIKSLQTKSPRFQGIATWLRRAGYGHQVDGRIQRQRMRRKARLRPARRKMPGISGARRDGKCARQDLDRVTCLLARSGRDHRGTPADAWSDSE
jgi:hypothetical protein